MVQVAHVDPKLGSYREGVELMEEVGTRLNLPREYLVQVTERLTGKPWDEVDAAGAKAVVDLLSEALHRTVSGTN